RDPSAARAELEKLQGLAREAMDELRAVVFQLRPPELEADGLAGTLRKHVEVLRRAYRRDVELTLAGEPRLGGDAHAPAFRIVQEALSNALRHARAQRLWVRLEERNGGLRAVVGDDGVGFDPAAPELRSRRLGLTSMEERAAALDAVLRISSAPGAGTTV